MASMENKPNAIDDLDLTKTKAVQHQSENAYSLTAKSRFIPSLNVSKARYGILLAEVLGPPLARRRRYGRWL
ncbi:MAG: hypothetical protein ACOX1Q_00180 [Eubacteriales bacterium]|jgi:hypothetical protein